MAFELPLSQVSQVTQSHFVEGTVHFVPKFALAILTFAALVVASRLVAHGFVRLGRSRRIPRELLDLFSQIIRAAGWIIGFVTLLGTVGVNISAAVAGLGLTGFGLSLAFKDLLTNLLSGAMILIYRPFHLGDHIQIKEHTGAVQEINLRYTVLAGEKGRILIPNSIILTEVVRVQPQPTALAIANR